MAKMIIDNRSSSRDVDALKCVIDVINGGRISNNKTQYCYGSTFPNYGVVVYSRINKNSDSFVVTNDNVYTEG